MFVPDIASPDAPADPGELTTELLEHQIELGAARANADICAWLGLVAEFDRRQAWGSWGCLTCAHWVAWRCSLSLRSAREHVRVAHAVRKLPRIHEQFAAGALSYSKVRALTRVATSETEDDLLDLASHATAAQLDRLVRAFSRASARAAGEVHRNRYVAWCWCDDGSLSLHATLSPEDGATVIAAIGQEAERLQADRLAWDEDERYASRGSAEQRRAELRPEEQDGSAEPLTGCFSRADALVSIASDSLSAPSRGAGDGKPADRNMVVVHVEAEELAAGGRSDARCHLRDGPGLSAEVAQRLACDASLVTLVERGGEPVSASRRTRTIPAATRRAVEARDLGCRFPGCHNVRWTDAHHIRHWAAGGESTAKNLLLLCRRHHRLLHEGGYSIELADDAAGATGAVVFRRHDGTVVDSSPAPPPLPSLNLRARKPAGPIITGGGEPMDLDLAVLAMFQICGSPRRE